MIGAVDWGTVPAWIGSLAGGVSLILAFHILIRDRSAAEASQARLVACWEHKPPAFQVKVDKGTVTDWKHAVTEDTIYLHNASDRPITAVRFFTRTATKRELHEFGASERLESLRNEVDGYRVANIRIASGSTALPDTVMPGERLEDSLLEEEKRVPRVRIPALVARRWISFRDAAGQEWCRDLQLGDLFRADSLTARRRLSGGTAFATLARHYFRPKRGIFEGRFPYW